MPAYPRRRLVDRRKVQVLHCWARCCRRCFLLGRDPVTGNNYDHRRQWIYDLLVELARLFSIEPAFHAEMSNHLHLVLRTRPDVVKRWSKEKVVRSWLKIAKLKRGSDDLSWEPPDERVRSEMADAKRVKRLRRRLCNVSWWMGALSENIARRANRADNCTGKFWEQRYRLRDLANESAILVCGIYVDLNPIRAGLTLTPEQSLYTSAYDRIQGRKQRQRDDAMKSLDPAACDRWLCELTIDESASTDIQTELDNVSPWRASDKGILSMTLEDYLKLLDWTGRQLRRDKRGSIPRNLAPILDRLNIDSEHWLQQVEQFK